jgi:hypothetical protein
MSFLIEKDGERQWVKTLEGVEDWTVLQEDAPLPPENAELVDGEWRVLPEEEWATSQREFSSMPREELVAWIEILEARIDVLESKVNPE